ncbi:N-formylglutamate deformylase [Marinomonas pollencensis]|uniref:Formiminoglutamase n=1 Tax=Marinomonas pollencensis TaxID=491954 RepID=A0A3E0DRU7_9GAMM|nr:N-formylglutamate deformylase [Marinomonas pollencensis]REG85052.1 formiminoglutamase [Marinomonas pollencensis]
MSNVDLQPVHSRIESPFEFHQGDSPLLVSMPHSGLRLTATEEESLTDKAQRLPDTDWYIPELYGDLAARGVSVISANYSRYVIDLNRPYDDAALYTSKTTGLFPDILFDESPTFLAGKEPSEAHHLLCKEQIWRPYHQQIEDELARIKAKFGYAILLDAHSIAAQVPMLFEGRLPDFNWGTNAGESCAPAVLKSAQECLSEDYSQVANGRFKGGYITRAFGQPAQGIHAIQLELSQATYLNDDLVKQGQYLLDDDKLPAIQKQISALVDALLQTKL